MKVHEFLNNQDKLLKGMWACDTEKMYTNPKTYKGICTAVKWDVDGAIAHCYQNPNNYDDMQAYYTQKTKLENFVLQNFQLPLYKWNDTQTYTTIIDTLKKLDI